MSFEIIFLSFPHGEVFPFLKSLSGTFVIARCKKVLKKIWSSFFAEGAEADRGRNFLGNFFCPDLFSFYSLTVKNFHEYSGTVTSIPRERSSVPLC